MANTSDGTVRRISASSLLLLDNMTGAGHATRIVSDEVVLIVSVTLAVNGAMLRHVVGDQEKP